MGLVPVLLRLMDYKHFRGRAGPEDRICIEWANRLRAYTLEGRLIGCWTHIANEAGGKGKLAAIQAAKAKALGLIRGSADFVFTKENGALWVEVKSDTGALTQAQRDFRDWALANGVDYVVVRSADEGDRVLMEKGFLKPCR